MSCLLVKTFFFLQSLCLKRYTIKRFKKISSWYNKNVTLYIFIFNFYVQFLCWFIIIWWWLISVKVLSCVPIQIKQTNISIFSPIFELTVSFADTLWLAICCDQGSWKRGDDKLDLCLLIKWKFNVCGGECCIHFYFEKTLKCWGFV